jgi:hypothetical protein
MGIQQNPLNFGYGINKNYNKICRFHIFDHMKSRILFLVVASLLLFSCQKSIEWPDITGGGSTNPQLLGVWKFKSLTQENRVTTSFTEGGIAFKNVTISKYTTINNGGSLEITDKLMSNKNLTYEVDTTGMLISYENNVLIDTTIVPINIVLPPYSASSPYTPGSGNTIIIPANPAAGEPARTMSYTIAGSKLYFYYTLNETTSTVLMGVTLTSVENSKIEIAYER